MDPRMRDELAVYGLTILRDGWRAGEAVVRRGERRWRGFRKWACALGVMLRAKELLEGRVAKR